MTEEQERYGKKAPVTVKQIITEYLKANGYDGLYDGEGCGCTLDDLAPGDCLSEECMAGTEGFYSDGNWRIGPEE